MIVDTMTYEELVNEILTDWNRNACPFFSRKLLAFYNKYRRAVLKSDPQKPLFFKRIEYESPRKNRFVVVPYSIDRSDFKKRGLCFIIYATAFYKKHWLLLKINWFGIDIITRHFIKRYLERFLNSNAGASEDIYLEFLKRNILSYPTDFDSQKGTEKCVVSDDGMFLGEQIGESCFLFKTYISRNQLFDNQRIAYERGLKKIEQYREYNHVLDYVKIAG